METVNALVLMIHCSLDPVLDHCLTLSDHEVLRQRLCLRYTMLYSVSQRSIIYDRIAPTTLVCLRGKLGELVACLSEPLSDLLP